MAYRYVQAKYFTAGGMREPRAVTIHMAEGGGTVEWLSGGVTNNNSCHFVVRYSGEIVQMVREADASHSLHLARPFGPPGPGDFGIFSADVAKAVLGTGISDPNRYLFAVEVEGFAAAGPNTAQKVALQNLVGDLRARHPTLRGNLGHRDFQAYKACPGGLIPWGLLGGHGLYGAATTTPGGLEMYPVVTREPLPAPNPRTVTFKAGTTVNGYDPAQPGKVVVTATFINASSAHATHRVRVDWKNLTGPRPIPDGYPFLLIADGTYAGSLVVEAQVALAPETPSGDCTAAVKAATDPLNARIAAARTALGA